MNGAGTIVNFDDFIHRKLPPIPWEEGEKIPWNEQGFSERMLKEHLSQQHDAASRRFETIDRHVDWIHTNLLAGRPSRILDLGCGPGFYLERLSLLGHECVGIDFSPSSIDYARSQANKNNQAIRYVLDDMRTAGFGTEFDLVMLIFGELNVFSTTDANLLIGKAAHALKKSGFLLIETLPLEVIKRHGQEPSSWYTTRSGLFSDSPHLCLEENFWDADLRATTHRYFVIDASCPEIQAYASSSQAYTDREWESMVTRCGFSELQKVTSIQGDQKQEQSDFIFFVASR